LKTRERIVEAAERVVREKGLARSTTKEIARAAGYSEGTLYKHFESKEDLFLAVLAERLPSFVVLVEELPARVGRGTLGQTLEEVASNALAFYGEIVPMAASIFSEPALLARHREGLRKRGAGPWMANEALAAYLDAEKRLGRVREDADPEAAAALILGACYQQAFFRSYLGEDVPAEREEEAFVESIVQTLMRSLSPTENERASQTHC
jgi:AcrR family transcriptional regulator